MCWTGPLQIELLVKWHIVAGILHTISFLLVVSLVASGTGSQWPLTIPSYDGSRSNWIVWYNLGWLLVPFPLLSALNHLVFAIFPGYRDRVAANLTNPIRWAEYSISAGLMIWVIATLSGVTELRTLLTLLLLNACLQYIGFLVESMAASQTRGYQRVANGQSDPASNGASGIFPSQLTAVGWLVFMSMWTEIIFSFVSVIKYDTRESPPDVIYAIVIVLFLLFSSFGALQLVYINGYLRNFTTYEIGFIVLSFVSKTVLTWMVYGGVINAGTNIRANNT